MPREHSGMQSSAFARLIFGIALVALSGCSTGTAPIPQTPSGTQPACNPGTQVALSNPLSGSQGNTSTGGYIEIVVNATKNVLGGGWNVILLDMAGSSTQGGIFYPAHSHSLYAPCANNYYYSATIPTLFSSHIYKVFLNDSTSSCQPALVGSFAT